MSQLNASCDPVSGDGNLVIDQLIKEKDCGIDTGLLRILKGLPGYRVVLLMDKGFKVHLHNPNQRYPTLDDLLIEIQRDCEGRLDYFSPNSKGGIILDVNLRPAAIPRLDPVRDQERKRMIDLEANTSAASCTKHRCLIEMLFCRYWTYKILGKDHLVPWQYLDRFQEGRENDTHCFHSKFFVILWVVAAINNCHGEMYRWSSPIQGVVNFTPMYVGHQIRHRITFKNPLDPFNKVRWPVGANGNLFTSRAGWFRVDVLNWNATGAPYYRLDQFQEISLGPFQMRLSHGYLASEARTQALEEDLYEDLDKLNMLQSQAPTRLEGFILDVQHEPGNCDDEAFGPFHPCRIVKAKIHSRMKTQVHDVAIMFVPRGQLPPPNTRFEFANPEMRRILGWCCGSSYTQNSCPIGARMVSCCAHVTAMLSLGFPSNVSRHISQGNPEDSDFRSTFQERNLMNIRPSQMHEDLAIELLERVSL